MIRISAFAAAFLAFAVPAAAQLVEAEGEFTIVVGAGGACGDGLYQVYNHPSYPDVDTVLFTRKDPQRSLQLVEVTDRATTGGRLRYVEGLKNSSSSMKGMGAQTDTDITFREFFGIYDDPSSVVPRTETSRVELRDDVRGTLIYSYEIDPDGTERAVMHETASPLSSGSCRDGLFLADRAEPVYLFNETNETVTLSITVDGSIVAQYGGSLRTGAAPFPVSLAPGQSLSMRRFDINGPAVQVGISVTSGEAIAPISLSIPQNGNPGLDVTRQAASMSYERIGIDANGPLQVGVTASFKLDAKTPEGFSSQLVIAERSFDGGVTWQRASGAVSLANILSTLYTYSIRFTPAEADVGSQIRFAVSFTTSYGIPGETVIGPALPDPVIGQLRVASAPTAFTGVTYSAPDGIALHEGGSNDVTVAITSGSVPGMTLVDGELVGSPTTDGTYALSVTVTDVIYGTTVSGTVNVTVETLTPLAFFRNVPSGPIVVGTSSSSSGRPTVSYTPSVFGGVAPYAYSLSGDLPTGITFSAATGAFGGQLTLAAWNAAAVGTTTFPVTLTVTDALGATADLSLSFALCKPVSGTCSTSTSLYAADMSRGPSYTVDATDNSGGILYSPSLGSVASGPYSGIEVYRNGALCSTHSSNRYCSTTTGRLVVNPTTGAITIYSAATLSTTGTITDKFVVRYTAANGTRVMAPFTRLSRY